LQIVHGQQQWLAVGQVHAQPVEAVHRRELRGGRITGGQAQRARPGPGRAGQDPAPLASGGRQHRLLQQLADDREGHLRLKLAAAGTQRPEPPVCGQPVHRRQQLRLPDPGRSADRHH
jgi:hypothetical protein